jgi:hypothetical protein
VKFFLDNNVSPTLTKAIHLLSARFGHEVWHLVERYDGRTRDLDWIHELSDEGGWCVVTQDQLRNEGERDAIRKSTLIVFLLDRGWNDWHYWEKAWNLIRWWPRILEHSEQTKGKGAFRVPNRITGRRRFERVQL